MQQTIVQLSLEPCAHIDLGDTIFKRFLDKIALRVTDVTSYNKEFEPEEFESLGWYGDLNQSERSIKFFDEDLLKEALFTARYDLFRCNVHALGCSSFSAFSRKDDTVSTVLEALLEYANLNYNNIYGRYILISRKDAQNAFKCVTEAFWKDVPEYCTDDWCLMTFDTFVRHAKFEKPYYIGDILEYEVRKQ